MAGVRRVDEQQQVGFAEKKILLSHCANCGYLAQPPRAMCPVCQSLVWDQVESPGHGHVYSWVVPRHGVPEDETHIICLVELAEGARFRSALTGVALADMRNGLAVEAYFADDPDVGPYLMFRPASVAVGPPATARPAHSNRPVRVARDRWNGVAISGIGQTEYSKNSGRTVTSLTAEASLAAIRDAGLTPADIDGIVTYSQDLTDESVLQQNLGIPELNWVGRAIGGGMASVPVLGMAAAAVRSGAARNVLVYRGMNERSEARYGAPPTSGDGFMGQQPPGARLLYTPAASQALWFQRYMSQYGVTNEDLAEYPLVARAFAATNPDAWFYQRPITLADHQASRWIVEPVLRLLDCCMESDGAAAMVISGSDQAADGPHPVVSFASISQGWTQGGGSWTPGFEEADLARWADCGVAATRAFGEAGLDRSDIDAMMIYESFSPMVYLVLEELGFCGRGEAAAFVRAGNIGPGGSIPVNTHGGHFGEAYMHGMNHNLEAVRQLRGTATNQVAGAQHVLVTNGHATTILASGR